MITNSGRHIQIAQKRYCSKCREMTDQVCYKVRYQDNSEEATSIIRKSYWICPRCLFEFEDVKKVLLPGDRVKIISRLLRMQDDYAITSMNISSRPEKLVVEITTKD